MGEKSVGEKSLGEKSMEKESLCKESLGEKYMGEKSVGEEYMAEKPVGDKCLGEVGVDGMMAFVPPFSGVFWSKTTVLFRCHWILNGDDSDKVSGKFVQHVISIYFQYRQMCICTICIALWWIFPHGQIRWTYKHLFVKQLPQTKAKQ